MKYSKFGGKEIINKVFRLVTQIVGQDKIIKEKGGEKDGQEGKTGGTDGKEANELFFENFFGPEVKEIIKVQIAYPPEKVAQCLVGPKNTIFGFEHVMPALGMEVVRIDPWEENTKTGSFARRFVYSHRRMDNIFLNKEIIDQTQTYTSKGYFPLTKQRFSLAHERALIELSSRDSLFPGGGMPSHGQYSIREAQAVL